MQACARDSLSPPRNGVFAVFGCGEAAAASPKVVTVASPKVVASESIFAPEAVCSDAATASVKSS